MRSEKRPGSRFYHSGPGLTVGPTLSATAGRKPAARLPSTARPVSLKVGRGAGTESPPRAGAKRTLSTFITFLFCGNFLSSLIAGSGSGQVPTKPCSRCGRIAQFSLCFLLSTLGQSPRQQKCTASVLFCASCIRAISDSMGTAAPLDLVAALRAAYTALNTNSENGSSLSKETLR